jgi:KipI family sensor histidine kinase inhibitor
VPAGPDDQRRMQRRRASVTRIDPFGEAALLVSFADTASVGAARRAQALASALRAQRAVDAWLRAPVTGVASVLVAFDPLAVAVEDVRAVVESLAATIAEPPDPERPVRVIEIPVRYGADDGPDLAGVAAESGLAPDEVIARHAAATYEVLTLGFAPGFAYLAEVDVAIRVPRLATPRPRVPAGSVAIAGSMTGVYPAAMPGGWRLIGRTELVLFDPLRADPATLHPGDQVRFVPVR